MTFLILRDRRSQKINVFGLYLKPLVSAILSVTNVEIIFALILMDHKVYGYICVILILETNFGAFIN